MWCLHPNTEEENLRISVAEQWQTFSFEECGGTEEVPTVILLRNIQQRSYRSKQGAGGGGKIIQILVFKKNFSTVKYFLNTNLKKISEDRFFAALLKASVVCIEIIQI